jgi:hypothetical protein
MPKPAHHDIMLSSTFKDLEKHRAVVIEAITALGMFPQAMDWDAALPDDIIDASLTKVSNAVAYIGIIGYRYGQTPESEEHNPKKLSITEPEYDEARKRKLPICIFVMSDDHPVPRSAVTQDSGEQQARLEAFRARVAKDVIHAEFESIEDLKSKALQSLVVIRDPPGERADRLRRSLTNDHRSPSRNPLHSRHGINRKAIPTTVPASWSRAVGPG